MLIDFHADIVIDAFRVLVKLASKTELRSIDLVEDVGVCGLLCDAV